ncbi:electron transport complex subunit E [Blastopirellula sp. JC732]|uniref:Ion-translocating oxidoreductase complex subunit E n=1 Tax=Blastopirellula sediminis TaxID=2894196 RepID=A0A9X1MJQ7_9BACT|nr:electron transport complex subunit E [Blastopirellula sediminis]MCC9609412.1 electron transport complex subunit E [Blastopirellula sediminis]MCC9627811.1 electron transport complex subunit E [Blastopirellula sediminis]
MSAGTMNDFTDGVFKRNPVFVQVLGMCPVLAVTNTAINSLAMGLATAGVLLASSAVVSLIRRIVPSEVRIVTFILIIATFVTMVDYLIQAISLELHRTLGAFIALIVVNCLILGRAEAFASKHPVQRSILDAAGMGVGFTVGLLCLGSVREILGAGTWFGIPLLGQSFETWTIMMLPPGGFFTLAGWLLLFQFLKQRKAASREATA